MTSTRRLIPVLLVAISGAIAATAFFASVASADLEFEKVGVQLREPSGTYSRQAGAHPDFTFEFSLPKVKIPQGSEIPKEAVHDVDLDLPPGMVGNPTPFLQCTPAELFNNATALPKCPIDSQIGTARVNAGGQTPLVALYNLTHGPEVPARFGFQYLGAMATITPRVRPTDYGISSASFSISQLLPISLVKVKIWGIPAATRNDSQRQPFEFPFINSDPASEESILGPLPTAAPRVPFFTNPTACPETPLFLHRPRRLLGDTPGVFDVRNDLRPTKTARRSSSTAAKTLPFDRALSVAPGTHRAHSPTGLDVNIKSRRTKAPTALAHPHVAHGGATFPRG